jgi:hypothetical protein
VINSIAVTFNNRVGILSTATQQDLYQISIKNGCNLSWNEWTNNVGSVLCLDFGLDLGLPINECPGIIGNYQLQIQLNISNTSASSVLYSLYVVVVNEGTYLVVDGSAKHQIGVISQSDCINATDSPEMPFSKANHVYGGSFWDKLKSGFQSIGRVLKPVAGKVLDYAASKVPIPLVGTVLREGVRGVTGVGLSGGGRRKVCKKPKSTSVKSYKSVSGKKVKAYCRRPKRGGVLLGGDLMSSADLKNRLEEDVSEEYEDL